ncbi:MAG: NAD(P)/FAD-dependent oxidoreductase [Sphaerochaetaceae bacterium]|nr:FAD-dependent oxidoreductase [Sphaerochaetaceae bacterium]MDD4258983.1 NAD(P)/FAD-dependent oxidoreductase [Sphaerochaetaceae bacterium]MDD4840866.1 NAD(P)/FAD-dependent oxidoreductase [Sphaerochaetaceae bacterium]NLO59974.1 NAD(P)/FAD-dependent oxidoreductase [Spirochaetales bacterium]
MTKKYGSALEISTPGSSIRLEGSLDTYQMKVEAGWTAARFGYKAVINDITVPDVQEETIACSSYVDNVLERLHFDVAIIGGGVIGTSIARELSKWNMKIILIEKEEDVGVHTSSRNDGMIHDGFAAKPGTLKALYNVRGNRLWEPLASDLGIGFKRPGSLLLFSNPAMKALYPLMADRAKRNEVDGWEFWSRERVIAEEPYVTSKQHGGFFLPSAAVISPYKATVALAESAMLNGAKLMTSTCLTGFEIEHNTIRRLHTNRGICTASIVINASGNWADIIAEMAHDRFFSLHHRRGTECILDMESSRWQQHIMSMPSILQVREKTKGGGIVLTEEGNVLIGPTAEEHPGREQYTTSPSDMIKLKKHFTLNSKLSMDQIITYFCGVRPCTYEEDFIVGPSDNISNLIHVAGIQSPGLASAPAIAADVAEMVIAKAKTFMEIQPKANWIPKRTADIITRRLSLEARDELIRLDPSYGKIICRCEQVSEKEVVNALHSTLPATSLDAVKRRTRVQMGRCHGGFCTARCIDIIARELHIDACDVVKKGPDSQICKGNMSHDETNRIC